MELIRGKRPQVLLLGNGLNRCFGGTSWDGLLEKIKERDERAGDLQKIPMALRAIYLTNNQVEAAMQKHRKELFGAVPLGSELQAQLQDLLSLGFDAILTTNYSYELEAAALRVETPAEKRLEKLSKNLKPGEKVEPKYLLSSFNRLPFANVENRIFHIHGEARKYSSMILSHYAYGNLVSRMVEYVKKREKAYLRFRKGDQSLTVQSWIDLFLFGDVYILGFSMDYSELDLWWLLDRKHREREREGDVYFWQAECAPEKAAMLELFGATVYTDQKLSENTDVNYREFLLKSMQQLHSIISERNACYV